MAALDKESEELNNNYLDIDIEVKAKKRNVKEGISLEERAQEIIDYRDKTYDDIVDQKFLDEFKETIDNVDNNEEDIQSNFKINRGLQSE